jgi:hypothetical protein
VLVQVVCRGAPHNSTLEGMSRRTLTWVALLASDLAAYGLVFWEAIWPAIRLRRRLVRNCRNSPNTHSGHHHTFHQVGSLATPAGPARLPNMVVTQHAF